MRPRLLAVALDAADPGLLRRWMDEGRLPTLASIASRGAVATLENLTPLLHESTWPTMLTGCGPGTHGVYNWRCLRPGTHSLVVSPQRTYRRPWWWLARRMDAATGGVLLIEVPGGAAVADRGLTAVHG